MSRHNGKLFQIEVDALQAYAPEEFKILVQQSVDKYFDQDIYNQVLSDPRALIALDNDLEATVKVIEDFRRILRESAGQTDK